MKTALIALTSLVAAFVSLAAGAFLALRAALAPLPGEWSVPLQVGFVRIEAGVPSLVRLATSPWGGPLLRGRSFQTRHGRLTLGWNQTQGALQIRCAPCVLQPPGLGRERVQLAELHATVHRQGEFLSGDAWSGRVRGQWQARLSNDRIELRVSIAPTPLADAYALFADVIPEVRQARIGGDFSLVAQMTLPAGAVTVSPKITGFEVSGLGTEALAGAKSRCSARAARLSAEHWLARAVVAAEDQRFFEHPGYDLTELAAAASRNGLAGIDRGASTLSQQVAKLLVTGDEQSPARKMRELLYAVEMERTLGKPRILRLYLDNAPWGSNGLCGAESAALHYFGVRADELTPAKAAWLAAMLHNPVMEARDWARSGRINVARAQWVAMGMRGMNRQKKTGLAQDLAAVSWSADWAEPAARSLLVE